MFYNSLFAGNICNWKLKDKCSILNMVKLSRFSGKLKDEYYINGVLKDERTYKLFVLDSM